MIDSINISTVLAAITGMAVMSKFIVHISLLSVKEQNAEIIKSLHEINKTLQTFQLNQAKENGEFVRTKTCNVHIDDVYNQIKDVRKETSDIDGRVSKIEGRLE